MLEIGKIPPEILDKIVMNPIYGKGVRRKDVILRPKTGEDCSAIELDGEICVLSTDPITGAVQDIGYLAVQINCNDIFSAGAEPIGILLTVLLPQGSTEESLQEIMQGAMEAAKELNIEILGGHTEVTDAVVKPLISATVIGKTYGRQMIRTGGAQVGQDVIMTKWAGVEGTAIIAKEYESVLQKCFSETVLENAQKLAGFLSVGEESRIAFRHGATAMHDATEGGILGAVWEMADCSGTGIEVYQEEIPILEETRLISEKAGIDPLRLISSGTMIIAAYDGEVLVEALKVAGISASVIGRITEGEKWLLKDKERIPLEQPQSDALYQVKFEG